MLPAVLHQAKGRTRPQRAEMDTQLLVHEQGAPAQAASEALQAPTPHPVAPGSVGVARPLQGKAVLARALEKKTCS